MKRRGNGQGSAHVLVAAQHQRRHVDARKHVAQIRLRRRVCHGTESNGMEPRHRRHEVIDVLLRRRFREHRREHRGHELRRRQSGPFHALLQALFDDICGEGTGPSCIRARQDERRRQRGMTPIELERQCSAERDPRHMRMFQAERRHEAREAVGVVRHPERLRRIRRPTGTRCVPRDDREVGRQVVDLTLPRRATVADEAVQEHEQRSVARAFVRDAKPLDLDVSHG